MTVRLRNTADHWFMPGDEGQVVTLGELEYRVVEVKDTHSPMILTYGLRLIPGEVELRLEPNDPVVVQ